MNIINDLSTLLDSNDVSEHLSSDDCLLVNTLLDTNHFSETLRIWLVMNILAGVPSQHAFGHLIVMAYRKGLEVSKRAVEISELENLHNKNQS